MYMLLWLIRRGEMCHLSNTNICMFKVPLNPQLQVSKSGRCELNFFGFDLSDTPILMFCMSQMSSCAIFHVMLTFVKFCLLFDKRRNEFCRQRSSFLSEMPRDWI